MCHSVEQGVMGREGNIWDVFFQCLMPERGDDGVGNLWLRSVLLCCVIIWLI